MVRRVAWSRRGSKDYSRALNPCQAGSGFYSQSPVQLPFYVAVLARICGTVRAARI